MPLVRNMPFYWIEREAPRLRAFVVVEHSDGVQSIAKNGMADRATALWVAQMLAKRSGGRVLSEQEMKAQAHIRRWEAIGGRFQLRWDVDDGQYHCWPVDPERDLDAAEAKELDSLRRSYRQVRPTLKAAMLSFLIDRDGDPKPDPDALEFIRIMRSERLDMERMTALAALYEHESVEPLLHSILRGLGPMIADWRELTCAANHLLLAAALVHRLQQPQLSLVRD